MPASAPVRQLIIAPHTMREALQLQPLAAIIRRNHPQTGLDAVATQTIAPVLEAMQVFDDIIAIPDSFASRLHGSWKLAASLRERDYDLSYNLNPETTAALAPWMARIAHRVGFNDQQAHALASRNKSTPTSGTEQPSQLANALPVPTLTATDDAVNSVRELLNRGSRSDPGGQPDSASPLIVMSPGARDASRRWPTRHFTNLAMRIKASSPATRLVLTGSADERQLCTELAAMGGLPFHNLAGQLDTAQQIALLAEADVVVCNESDLMHLAAACDTPTVALFGPSDPGSNPPMSSRASVLWMALECSPCDSSVCPLGHNNCLHLLEPGQVIGTVEQALASNARQRPVG